MAFLQKFSRSRALKFITFILVFIGWLLPYLARNFEQDFMLYEVIGQSIVGLTACLFLILFKDTFLVLEIVLLFPFMFARDLNMYTIPLQLFIIVPALLVSFIIHVVIHREKLRVPKMFLGMTLVLISFFLGGLLVPFENKFVMTLLLFGLSFGLVFLFLFFGTTAKPSFYDLAYVMNLLGSLLILQILTYGALHPDIFLLGKTIEAGWATNSNNIGMMLLFTYPFTFYLGFKEAKVKKFWYYFLSYVTLIAIIFSYSRGSILAAVVAFSLMIVVFIIMKETRKEAILYLAVGICLLIFGVLAITFFNPELLKAAIGQITKINLDNLNGRTPIYEQCIKEFLEQPIFGYGLFHYYNDAGDYMWGHSTLLETASTFGSVGLIGMGVHFFEKYKFCLKKGNVEKMILLFGFIATDIYGFMDVSYFFVNFMFVMLFVLISCNHAFKEEVEELDYASC